MAKVKGGGRADRTTLLAELVRYGLIGLANTAFAYGVYVLALELAAPYQLAVLIAVVAGVGVSFVTQGTVVFRRNLSGRLWLFTGLWVLLYCANITVIGALGRAGLGYQLSGLVAAIPLNLIAFFLQKRVIFSAETPDARRLVIPWALALLAVAWLDVAVRSAAHWDEFLNLSMVYSYARGDLQEILQTAFVHILAWVPLVSPNELEQIIAARLLMLGMALTTALAIHGIARRYVEKDAALVAAFAWAGLTVAIAHGHALRTDTMATACMMGAIWLTVVRRPSIGTVLAIASLAGLAGAFTIKAAFLLPPLGVLFCLQLWNEANRARSVGLLVLGAAAGVGTFALIVELHASTFPVHGSALRFVERTSGATLFSGDYSIVGDYLPKVILLNAGFLLLVAGGLARSLEASGKAETRMRGLAMASFALPLVSLAVYRDAYLYFYPFILAPVAVLAGVGYAALGNRLRIVTFGLLAAAALAGYLLAISNGNQQQRLILATIHDLFPKPVPYIDHASMVSSFPKHGIFMSRWGMTDYRRQNVAIMPGLIEKQQPKFMLATRDLLDIDRIDPAASQRNPYGLLEGDVRALQDQYQRYWGPIYLPAVKLVPGQVVRVKIPGRYRLDGTTRVTLGGAVMDPGAERSIKAGSYAIVSSAPATLRWAAPPPPASEPPESLFPGL